MQEHSSSLSVDGATSKTVVHEAISSHQDDHGHSNLEAAELNSGHWGDLPHFSARSLCKPFHILEGRKVLFPPEDSNYIGTSTGFGYNARGRQKGLAIRSANMREGQRNELFYGTAQRPRGFFVGAAKRAIHLPRAYAVQYLLNPRTELELYDHRHDCHQDENFI